MGGVARTPLELLQEDLPEGLNKDKKYEDDGELWEDLERLHVTDLQIVLDDEGYVVWREMNCAFHNAAVEEIQELFIAWKHRPEQVAQLCILQEPDVYYMKNYKKNNKRVPDLAIWGPDRLNERGRTRENTELQKKVNPHVIVQFSWGNALDYEKRAIDNLSRFAGVSDYSALERPNVIYLIRAKCRGGYMYGESPVVHGFDVYEIRQGQRIDHPTFTYCVGGDESWTIEVAAEDMGLPESASSFSIPIAHIRAGMEGVGAVFSSR
jgi:hypothetical protein